MRNKYIYQMLWLENIERLVKSIGIIWWTKSWISDTVIFEILATYLDFILLEFQSNLFISGTKFAIIALELGLGSENNVNENRRKKINIEFEMWMKLLWDYSHFSRSSNEQAHSYLSDLDLIFPPSLCISSQFPFSWNIFRFYHTYIYTYISKIYNNVSFNVV